jgi:hypothetical protein
MANRYHMTDKVLVMSCQMTVDGCHLKLVNDFSLRYRHVSLIKYRFAFKLPTHKLTDMQSAAFSTLYGRTVLIYDMRKSLFHSRLRISSKNSTKISFLADSIYLLDGRFRISKIHILLL